MSPNDLGFFGLDKRAAAADEASSSNAAADDTVAKAVAHTACVYYNCCAGQHKIANKGARAARCRDLAYQRCHLDVCVSEPTRSTRL